MAQAFDPDRVAYYETEGWRAYYDRKWPRLLRLLVALCHQQFRIPYPQALLAAYYVTRASAAWVPVDHDETKVLGFYERFYRQARRYSGLRFDPARATRLELRYNDDHRRLTGSEDKAPLLQTLTELHAELFGLEPAAVAESARYRLEALNAVDRITSHRSTDVDADWRSVDDNLRACYRSIVAHSSKSAR